MNNDSGKIEKNMQELFHKKLGTIQQLQHPLMQCSNVAFPAQRYVALWAKVVIFTARDSMLLIIKTFTIISLSDSIRTVDVAVLGIFLKQRIVQKILA